MAPVRTKTFANKARPASRRTEPALSSTRFRTLRTHRFTWRNLVAMATNKALIPKRLERLIALSSLMSKVPFQAITNSLVAALNLEVKAESENPSAPPTIILTTPDGDIVPFDEIPSWRKCSAPGNLRELHQGWFNSGLLCPLHAVGPKKVRSRKTKK